MPPPINQVRTKVNPPGMCHHPMKCATPHEMCHLLTDTHYPPPTDVRCVVHADGGSGVPWPLGPNLGFADLLAQARGFDPGFYSLLQRTPRHCAHDMDQTRHARFVSLFVLFPNENQQLCARIIRRSVGTTRVADPNKEGNLAATLAKVTC